MAFLLIILKIFSILRVPGRSVDVTHSVALSPQLINKGDTGFAVHPDYGTLSFPSNQTFLYREAFRYTHTSGFITQCYHCCLLSSSVVVATVYLYINVFVKKRAARHRELK